MIALIMSCIGIHEMLTEGVTAAKSYLIPDDEYIKDFTYNIDEIPPIREYDVVTIPYKTDGPGVQDRGSSTRGSWTIHGTCQASENSTAGYAESYARSQVNILRPLFEDMRLENVSFIRDEVNRFVSFTVTYSYRGIAATGFFVA